MGLSLHKLGKYEEAILCYEECIKLKPNFASGYHYKGLSL